jgi:hypothetical protein
LAVEATMLRTYDRFSIAKRFLATLASWRLIKKWLLT